VTKSLESERPATAEAQPAAGRRRALLVALPLLAFAALAVLFLVRLEQGGDPSVIPSALIGRPAPATNLPPLEGLARDGAAVPGISSEDLTGRVTLVNVFASWCGPCRLEHPILMRLAEDDGLRIVGINYKDQPENARRFLGSLGNPYAAVGTDSAGRTAIDWGSYGVPETFLVGRDGRILAKFVGPLTEEALAGSFGAAIAAARKASAGSAVSADG
jgi:cytochrome c biogenesis protein CcmG/thiol:disulfide interchange protein DsbE